MRTVEKFLLASVTLPDIYLFTLGRNFLAMSVECKLVQKPIWIAILGSNIHSLCKDNSTLGQNLRLTSLYIHSKSWLKTFKNLGCVFKNNNCVCYVYCIFLKCQLIVILHKVSTIHIYRVD